MINKVKQDIKKLIVNLQKKHLIVNARFADRICTENQISTGTRFIKQPEEYEDERIKAYDNDEYLFALDNGAFFQVNYTCSPTEIISANLSYWPEISNQEYIRYDYAKTLNSDFYHCISHIHIGIKNELRIPINKILLTSDFVLIILFLYDKESFEKIKDLYRINTKDLRLIENKTVYKSNYEFFYLDYKK